MKFLLKGSRDYIHGTDIFIYLENKLKNLKFTKFELIFKQFIKNQPKIKMFYKTKKTTLLNLKQYYALCEIILKKKKLFYVFEKSREKINSNYSYDENLFIKYYNLKKNGISCSFETSFKDIEILVSMTKYFHQKKIKKKCKWIFNKIELIKKFKNFYKKDLEIKIISNKYNKYTISQIFQNKKNIGKIYFSSK